VDRQRGQHSRKRRVSRHHQTGLPEALHCDGQETGHGTRANPVRVRRVGVQPFAHRAREGNARATDQYQQPHSAFRRRLQKMVVRLVELHDPFGPLVIEHRRPVRPDAGPDQPEIPHDGPRIPPNPQPVLDARS
jgi:hypothetical protein